MTLLKKVIVLVVAFSLQQMQAMQVVKNICQKVSSWCKSRCCGKVTRDPNRRGYANGDRRRDEERALVKIAQAVQIEIGHAQCKCKEEDAFCIVRQKSQDVVGVFDGHTITKSPCLAQEAADRLFGCMNEKTADSDTGIAERIKDYFNQTELYFSTRQDANLSGICAVAAAIQCVEQHGRAKLKITIANLGDCRAVLYQGREVLLATRDHKPDDKGERERIERAGGSVEKGGLELGDAFRVGGWYGCSRSLGDYYWKGGSSSKGLVKGLSAEPEFYEYVAEEFDNFYMVLASDGVWDVLTSGVLGMLASACFQEGYSTQQVADFLIKEAALISRASYNDLQPHEQVHDDMTLIVVRPTWKRG